jgi:hypothetical protein
MKKLATKERPMNAYKGYYLALLNSITNKVIATDENHDKKISLQKAHKIITSLDCLKELCHDGIFKVFKCKKDIEFKSEDCFYKYIENHSEELTDFKPKDDVKINNKSISTLNKIFNKK